MVFFYRVMRDGKSYSICFSDLAEQAQNEVLADYDEDSLRRMCKILAGAPRSIGDQFGLMGRSDDCKKKGGIKVNLHEMFFETFPAMKIIFELGFIPEEDDIHELLPEMYALYESKGGDISKRLYTIVSKDENIQTPENKIGLLTEDDLPKIQKGIAAIRIHAKRAGCVSDNSDEILAAAVSVIPAVFSQNSRFACKEDA